MRFFYCFILVWIAIVPCSSQVLSNNGAAVNILSGTVISNTSLENNSGAITNAGTLNLTDLTLSSGSLSNNAVLTVTGAVTNAGTISGSGSVELNGTGAQTILSTGSFDNLKLNKPSGTATLLNNVTLGGVLNFALGNITTGSDTLVISNGGGITGSSQNTGWVYGNLQKYFSTTTGTFETGSQLYYSPLSLTFSSLTTPGSLIAKATTGYQANIGTSQITTGKNINRYWTLSYPPTGAAAFTNATIVFNWNTADNYSPITGSLEKLAEYSSGVWSYPAVSGTPTTTSLTATGIATPGDFTIGETRTKIYVNDNSSTGDIYTSAIGSNSNAGTAAAPYLTIAYALSLAHAGDTIYVDAGTYPEHIDADRRITLLGANAAISPNTGTRGAESILNYTASSAISVSTSSRVTIKGFRITTAPNASINSNASGNINLEKNFFDGAKGINIITPDSFLFTDNRLNNIAGGTDAVFLQGNYNGTTGTYVDISNNTWLNGQFPGMNISSSQGSIYNNVFNGIAYYGFLVANYCNLTITRNTFTGITNPDTTVNTYGSGIRFYTPTAGMTASVTNNYFTNNYIGVAVRAAGGSLSGTYVSVSNNYFSGNTYANINHAGTGTMDASCNWFGTTSQAIIAASILGPVNYVHYLNSGTDNDGVTAGFQPAAGTCVNPSRFYVNDAATTGDVYSAAVGNNSNPGTTAAPFLTIGYAMSVANSGDTIYVDAGSYPEQVVASKKITLLGANAAISPNTGSRGSESILNYSSNSAVSVTTTSRVTIKGFRVTTTPSASISSNTVSAKVTLEKNFFDGSQGLSLITPDSVTFFDNKLNNITATNEGLFIQGNYNGTTGTWVDINNNTWTSGQYTGMNLGSCQGSVDNNSFTNIAYYGILVANYCNLSITRNTFTGMINPDTSVNTYGSGIRFYTPSAGMTATITNNSFINGYVGVAVRAAGGNLTGTNISVNNNYFSGNTYAQINHTGTGTMSATCNWYGTTDTSIISPLIKGPVSWVPLLTSGTDNDLVTAGFQPASGTCAAPNTWTGSTSTDWNTAGNWSHNTLPVSSDYITIPTSPAGGRMPTLASGTSTISSLTIQSGATLTHTGGSLNSQGVTNISGTYSQSGGTYLAGGTITLNTGGVVNESGSGNLHLDNAGGTTATNSLVMSASSSLNQSGGTIQTKDLMINASACTYAQSGGLLQISRDYINNGVFNGTGGTIEWIGTAAAPVFSGTNQFYNFLVDPSMSPGLAAGGSISVAGNYTTTTYTAPATSTVTFNGTGSQGITGLGAAGRTFGNLVVNKSAGVATLLTNADLAGNTTITAGSFDLGTYTSNRTSAGGTLTVAAGASLLVGGSGGGQSGSNYPANFTTNTLAATGTVNYNGSNAITQTVYSTTYGHLMLTNSSGSGTANKVTSGNISVAGNLTVNGNVVFTPAAADIISGAGTLTGTGTAQVTRTSAAADFATQYSITGKTLSGLTIDYFATTAQSVNPLNYGNLTVSGVRTSNNVTYASGGVIGISGIFLSSATFTTGGHVVTGSSFDFNGNGAQGIPAFKYNNLTVSGARTSSNVTYASGGTIGIAGVFSPAATFTSGANVVTGSTIDFNSTGAQNVPSFSFNNLIVSGSASTKTATGALSAAGALTVNTGVILDMSSYPLSGGLTAISGAGAIKTQNTSASPIPAGKSWTCSIDYNATAGGQTAVGGTYTSLSNSNTSGSNTAGGAIVVSTALTLNASSLLNMSTYTLSGALSSISGTGTLKTQNTTATPIPTGKTWPGTIEYNAAAGAQTIVSGTYSSLTNTNTSGSNTAGGALSVNGTLTLNTSSLMDMGSNVLGGSLTTIAGAGTLKTQNTTSLPIPGGKSWTGTVEYNAAAGGQTVVAGTYSSLTNTNTSGVNTAGGALSVSGTLNLNASSVIDMGAYVLSGTLTTIAGTGKIKTQNTTSSPLPVAKTWTGIVEYNAATGGQTLAAGTYANLTNTNTSGLNTAGGALSVTGTLTLNSSSVLDMAANALSGTLTTITGTGTLKTQNTTTTPIPTGKTWTGTIDYNKATGGQTVVAGTYTNLSNSNTSGINTAAAALSVSGILTLNTSSVLDLGAYALSGTVTSITGLGTLKTQNTTATPIPTGKTWTGTIEYNKSNGSQAVVSGNYGNLTISNTSGSNATAAAITVTGTTTLNASAALSMTGTGTSSLNNLTLGSAASLSINNAILQLAGITSGSGTINATAGSVVMNGSSSQTIPAGLFATNTVKDLTTSNSAGVTLGGTLKLTGILKAGNGTFSTGSYLTLLSSVTQTALIDGSGSGSVLGSVTMQRYVPSGFGYKYLSSPFAAATVAQLANDVNLIDTFPRVYRYDENLSSAGWVNYTDTNGILNPMQGYAVNLGAASPAKTIDISGTVNNGSLSSTLYNHNRAYSLGFNLVGNPYPSPIDWNAASGWTKTNVDNALYYFDAGSTDQYRGAYSSYVNGVSSDGIASNLIASMQGFFVHVSNGSYPVSATLATNNSVRVNNLSPAFHKQTGGTDYPLIRLSAGYEGDSAFSDPAVIYFNDKLAEAFNAQQDALKMMNTDDRVPNFYSVSGSDKLAISSIPEPGGTTKAIPLGIRTEKDATVVFKARDINRMPAGLHVYFADVQSGVIQDLESMPTYKQQLNKGDFENRFYLLFSRQDKVSMPGSEELNAWASGNKVVVSTINGGGNLSITNTLGQVIYQETLLGNGQHEIRLDASPGIYIISLTTDKSTRSRKLFLGGN